MIYIRTKLQGAYIIDIEPHNDERGFFARSWCSSEFAQRGLSTTLSQCNISFNKKRGTLRGMHYQSHPYAEEKLVRCTKGAIYDVIVDLNKQSPTFLQWLSVELTEDNYRMLYVPKIFAHGFQALSDNSEVFYQISTPFKPDHSTGFIWNDPLIDIQWPIENPIISQRDSNFDKLSSLFG